MQVEKTLINEELAGVIEKNYGVSPRLEGFITFVSSEDKIWLVTRSAFELSKKLNFNSMGINIGKMKRPGRINLSLDGIQLLAKNAAKNIVTIDEPSMRNFMQGINIEGFQKIDCEEDNFVLVRYKDEFIGTGILRNDKIENLLPKSRRIYKHQ